MDRIFVSDIYIRKVRHLEDVRIPVSEKELMHLIITGKNGLGKTSLLKAMVS